MALDWHAPCLRYVAEMCPLTASSQIPCLPSSVIRERWQGLLDRAYASGQVTHGEIERGVNVVIAAPSWPVAGAHEITEGNVRAAFSQIPGMARGFRLRFDKVALYGLALEKEHAEWLGRFRKDVVSGRTDVAVFVDLAYLEAALLDQLYQFDVVVDFRIPLVFFSRGGLADSANALEAAATMVFEGRSLLDAAARLARDTLSHLEAYAAAFWKLSRLYGDLRWRIEQDNFVMEVPGKNLALALHYCDLRASEGCAFESWQRQIESLLGEAGPFTGSGPKSFAA